MPALFIMPRESESGASSEHGRPFCSNAVWLLDRPSSGAIVIEGHNFMPSVLGQLKGDDGRVGFCGQDRRNAGAVAPIGVYNFRYYGY